MGRSYRASKEGVERANRAFQLKGCSQDYLAGAAGCTRQTVSKFFAQRPVAKYLFQAICNELKLQWGETVELEREEEQSSRKLGMDTEREKICEIALEDYSNTQVLTSPVSVAKKQNVNCNAELVITFKGDIQSFLDKPQVQAALLVFLQEASGDESVKIEKIEKGSIKITFSGSSKGLKRLEEQIKSGELTQVTGMPVEDVQLLPGGITEEEQDKFRLVQEIIAQGAKGRNLSDANLKDANLRGADLSNADLSCADMTRTNLRDANLRDADLNCADLSGSDLTDADLCGAYLHDVIIDEATRISDKWRLVWEIVNQVSKDLNLSGADLSGANLSGANLRGVNLSGADLRDANLSDANLSNTNLSNADLSNADLSNADLSNADLSNADLSNAHLSNAHLSNEINQAPPKIADLVRANMTKLKRCGVKNLQALARGEVLPTPGDFAIITITLGIPKEEQKMIWQQTFNIPVYANLSGANLRGANLNRADLSDADLSSANLRGANLRGANLNRADLSGADFENAIVKKALFEGSLGLAEDVKRDLEKRGGIFGDRPPVLAPR